MTDTSTNWFSVETTLRSLVKRGFIRSYHLEATGGAIRAYFEDHKGRPVRESFVSQLLRDALHPPTTKQ